VRDRAARAAHGSTSSASRPAAKRSSPPCDALDCDPVPRGATAALALASVLAAFGSSWACGLEFSCQDDPQCTLDGQVGTCEPDGFCSFPDSSCESGRRYHRSAADGVAGRCTTAAAEGSSGDSPEPSPPDLPSPAPGCGDGVVDGDEQCDDGNAVDGDGCNTDCIPSGQVVWNAEYDGLDDGDDDAWGIALGPAGDVFVVGRVGLDAEGSTAAWVRKYDAGGTELWTRDVVHGDAGKDGALSVALRPDGALLVAGWAATTIDPAAPDDLEDFWLAALDPDTGIVQAETVFDGNRGNDRIRGITITSDGDVVGTGWVGGSPEQPDDDLWYGRFDGQTLAPIWSETFDGEVGDDQGSQPAALGSGQLVVVGSLDRFASPRAWLRRLDADGNTVETVTSDDVSLWTGVATIPGSTDLMLGGTRFDGLGRAVARRVSVAGDTVWSGGWSDAEPSQEDELYALAVGPAGELVLAGRVDFGNGEGWDAWIAKFDPAGNHLWTRTHPGSAGSSDVASGVAVDQDGSVVLVGYRISASNGRNIWVRKYTP